MQFFFLCYAWSYMSKHGQSGRNEKGQFSLGHYFNIKLPYEIRLIRDSVKSAIYSAAAGLAMPIEKAKQYYERPDATLLENIFAKAIASENYEVLERFLDRLMGKAPSPMIAVDAQEGSFISELTKEQKRMAIEAAAKTISDE